MRRQTGAFQAIVCLGCLIRGATPHFEYIASAVSHGLTEAAGATGVPMTFGVLTTNSVEEALERAGDGPSNKGWEAAVAAVEMATLLSRDRAGAAARREKRPAASRPRSGAPDPLPVGNRPDRRRARRGHVLLAAVARRGAAA